MKKSVNIMLWLVLTCSITCAKEVYYKKGIASYYHDYFAGRQTANGEIFSQNKMTCAHLSLPFGTKLKITNLQNSKSVFVTVNDRGPYVQGRLVDLSKAAAEKLGFIDKGIVTVQIEIVQKDSDAQPSESLFSVKAVKQTHKTKNAEPFNPKQFEFRENMRRIALKGKGNFGRKLNTQNMKGDKEAAYIIFIGVFYRQESTGEFLEKAKDYVPNTTVNEVREQINQA
jgi:rare lipoprotein A